MSPDVIIVGASVAGSTCATALSKQNIDVLMLDKAKFPRDKTCGGGISAASFKLLKSLPEDIKERACHGMKLYVPGRKPLEYCVPETLGYFVRRVNFDNYLYEKAKKSGATASTEKVIKVSDSEDGVTVETDTDTHHTDIVIGADGVNSTVAKTAGIRNRWQNDEVIVALEKEIEYEEVDELKGLMHLFTLLVNNTPVKGYGWVFPKRNHINIGIGIMQDQIHLFRKAKEQFIGALESIGINEKLDNAIAWRLPVCTRKRKLVGKRTILIGDAAGLGDPFTGEGIRYAIESGLIAAQVTFEAITTEKPIIAPARYQHICDKKIVSNLLYGKKFTDIAYRHFDEMYALGQDRRILEKHVQLVNGTITYKKFMTYMFFKHPILSSRMWLT